MESDQVRLNDTRAVFRKSVVHRLVVVTQKVRAAVGSSAHTKAEFATDVMKTRKIVFCVTARHPNGFNDIIEGLKNVTLGGIEGTRAEVGVTAADGGGGPVVGGPEGGQGSRGCSDSGVHFRPNLGEAVAGREGRSR